MNRLINSLWNKILTTVVTVSVIASTLAPTSAQDKPLGEQFADFNCMIPPGNPNLFPHHRISISQVTAAQVGTEIPIHIEIADFHIVNEIITVFPGMHILDSELKLLSTGDFEIIDPSGNISKDKNGTITFRNYLSGAKTTRTGDEVVLHLQQIDFKITPTRAGSISFQTLEPILNFHGKPDVADFPFPQGLPLECTAHAGQQLLTLTVTAAPSPSIPSPSTPKSPVTSSPADAPSTAPTSAPTTAPSTGEPAPGSAALPAGAMQLLSSTLHKHGSAAFSKQLEQFREIGSATLQKTGPPWWILFIPMGIMMLTIVTLVATKLLPFLGTLPPEKLAELGI